MKSIRIILALALPMLALAGCEDAAEETPETSAVAEGDPEPQPAAAEETGAEEAVEEAVAIDELEIDRVAELIEAGEAVPVDANSDSTREELGVLPNAILLTSSGRYEPTEELPEDKATQLVFYCGNTDCRASDGAAERAKEAGYTHVAVMRAGIAGWAEAGKPTQRPNEA